MVRISLGWENALLDYSILRFSRWCKNQTAKLSQNKLQNKTINLLSYIFSAHTHILYPWVSILSISHFLETDSREQQKYEKRLQKYVDNTINGLLHEIKFEICMKNIIIIIIIIIIQLPRHLPTAKANFERCVSNDNLTLNSRY